MELCFKFEETTFFRIEICSFCEKFRTLHISSVRDANIIFSVNHLQYRLIELLELLFLHRNLASLKIN